MSVPCLLDTSLLLRMISKSFFEYCFYFTLALLFLLQFFPQLPFTYLVLSSSSPVPHEAASTVPYLGFSVVAGVSSISFFFFFSYTFAINPFSCICLVSSQIGIKQPVFLTV